MHQRVKEVFSPIFFHYTNGLKDRSAWTPRDTGAYIRRWYELASMRTRLTTDAAATEDGEHLSRDQVSMIFKLYMPIQTHVAEWAIFWVLLRATLLALE